MTFTRSEGSRSSNDVMVTPKHPKWHFIAKIAGSAEVLMNANKQYILTNMIRGYSLIIIKLFFEKRRGEERGR